MSQIICPECLKQVGADADKCPHCGHQMKGENGKKTVKKKRRKITGCVLFFAILLVLCGAAYVAWRVGLLAYVMGKEGTEDDQWALVEKYKSENNADSLEIALDDYILFYQKGKYIVEAENLMKLFSNEKQSWIECVEANNTSGVHKFLDAHPDGFFRTKANHRLDSLSYVEAKELNTQQAYESYINAFPTGMYYSDAIAVLESFEIKKLSPEDEARVKRIIVSHFNMLATNNGDSIESTMEERMTSYIGLQNASPVDVQMYLDHMHKTKREIVFNQSDWVLGKMKNGGRDIYSARFVLTEEEVKEGEPTTRYFDASVILSPQMKIQTLDLTPRHKAPKQETEEE